MYRKYKCGFILTLFAVLFPLPISFSQAKDYKIIFGNDWEKAESFVSENETWMRQFTEKYDVSYSLAIAVVFPELIRYSALQDKMEITLLKALYINLGEDYANFSIGRFQMKPSFAEAIDQNAKLLRGQIRNQFRAKISIKDIKKYRSSVVRDLEQPESQFLYLIAFIKICESTYGLKDIGEIQRVKFLATAYNYSFQKSFEEVKEMIDKKFFYAKLIKTETFSYSDISAYWYNNYQKEIPVITKPMPVKKVSAKETHKRISSK